MSACCSSRCKLEDSLRLALLSTCQSRRLTKQYIVTRWSVLHWIDVVVHTLRAHVAYSYILVGCCFNVIRGLSDVCVLWGTMKVLIRYEDIRPSMASDYFAGSTIIGCLLWFLALYHLCLQFALSFAWLSFADLSVIDKIAEARSCFEIAFTVVQFISTIWIVVWAYDSFTWAGAAPSTYKKV